MILVLREDWGARLPKDRDPLPNAVGVAVHYSASAADSKVSHTNCAARVRGIQNFHMDVQGWLDIAYSHLFCVHGYVYEGRGFAIRTAANGTNHANSLYHAVCFLGNDVAGRDDVTRPGRFALDELLNEYAMRKYSVVKGHRDFVATKCPGDELYRFVQRWQQKDWPMPLPLWFWPWARWFLGEGEFADHRRDPKVRPANAPTVIPRWAWRRLEALLKGRK